LPIPLVLAQMAITAVIQFYPAEQASWQSLFNPATFCLLDVNIVYAVFETFGVIHTITSGGSQQATPPPTDR